MWQGMVKMEQAMWTCKGASTQIQNSCKNSLCLKNHLSLGNYW
jgi:hypothetical protein